MLGGKQKFGKIGEDIAARYLAGFGYEVLARNYRCRLGEIDIICRSPDRYLVFVEVKARMNDRFGVGLESVTHTKRGRIVRASMKYISENNYTGDVRFDVISVTIGGDNSIEHIVNAFDAY